MEKRVEPTYSDDLALSRTRPPRMRAVIEFIEGDLSRPPLVFPEAGGEQADAQLREEILKRWARRDSKSPAE